LAKQHNVSKQDVFVLNKKALFKFFNLKHKSWLRKKCECCEKNSHSLNYKEESHIDKNDPNSKNARIS